MPRARWDGTGMTVVAFIVSVAERRSVAAGLTGPPFAETGTSRTYALPPDAPGTSWVCSTPPCARTMPRTRGPWTGSPPA